MITFLCFFATSIFDHAPPGGLLVSSCLPTSLKRRDVLQFFSLLEPGLILDDCSFLADLWMQLGPRTSLENRLLRFPAVFCDSLPTCASASLSSDFISPKGIDFVPSAFFCLHRVAFLPPLIPCSFRTGGGFCPPPLGGNEWRVLPVNLLIPIFPGIVRIPTFPPFLNRVTPRSDPGF